MTTILLTFVLALAFSLVLTPFSGWVGVRFGGMDVPGERKVHTKATPRTGGLAIFLSVFLVTISGKLWKTDVTELFIFGQNHLFLISGAVIVFGIGFVDDFHRLNAGIKFLFQVLAASIAFYGGFRIAKVGIFESYTISIFFSYFLTVFWFVFIINAVNLVDGLDGLAGGIVVFACLIIMVLNVMRQEYLTGMLFAAIGGATLGFLRYNFNPASIFLGDGGSYFLGYSIAALSIMGSAKAQMGAVFLIPVLALGVPLFDAVLAPLRRFIRGKKMFSPDSGHIHHRLKEMGLSSERVVWLLYGITAVLGIIAVIIVNLRDERAGLFLVVLGIGAVLFVRKLGYFEYFAVDKVYGWIRDMADVSGLGHERRSFLNVQMDLSASKDLEGLWGNTVRGMEMLGFDLGEMVLRRTEDRGQRTEDRGQRTEDRGQRTEDRGQRTEDRGQRTEDRGQRTEDRGQRTEDRGQRTEDRGQRTEDRGQRMEDGGRRTDVRERRVKGRDPKTLGFPDRRKGSVDRRINQHAFSIDRNIATKGRTECQCEGQSAEGRAPSVQRVAQQDARNIANEYTWIRHGFDVDNKLCGECLLKIELPLLKEDGESLGTLWLVKDLEREPVTHYTLRRIEHLRRTLTSTIMKLQNPPHKK